MIDYLKKDNAISQLVRYASNNNVALVKNELSTSEEIIETQLHAYIIRNILDNEGFYPVIEKIDNTLQIAIGELTKTN